MSKKVLADSFRFFTNFRRKYFCSKSARMKILVSKVGMGINLYETNFFFMQWKNWALCNYVVNAPRKKRFCDFSPMYYVLEFYGLLNYIPSGILICFPLLWRIFFGLYSSPIKYLRSFNECKKINLFGRCSRMFFLLAISRGIFSFSVCIFSFWSLDILLKAFDLLQKVIWFISFPQGWPF